MRADGDNRFYFPKWFNRAWILLILPGAVLAPAYALGMFYYATSPKTVTVGYEPKQPVPYSHALHAGKLGMDCRYCHLGVDKAAHASIPATETCMTCHKAIATKRESLQLVRNSYVSGEPIPWVRIHKVPDYAYFNHSAHVTRGVGCVECHGRIDKMEVVSQFGDLSMGWCLDCHRNPEPHLRPKELVTQMDWTPGPGVDRTEFGSRLRKEYNINPSTDCTTCHR
jgi:hypothetical protein